MRYVHKLSKNVKSNIDSSMGRLSTDGMNWWRVKQPILCLIMILFETLTKTARVYNGVVFQLKVRYLESAKWHARNGLQLRYGRYLSAWKSAHYFLNYVYQEID